MAFAPGHGTAVLRLDSPSPRTDGALLTLAPAGDLWNPELAALAYPFEHHPELAAELAAEAHAPLRQAFREAWTARPRAAGPPTASELLKMGIFGLR